MTGPTRHLVFFILACGLYGCTGRTLDERGLNEFVRNEENGLIKTAADRDFIITAFVRPSSLVALQQARSVGIEKLDSLKDHYADHLYFALEIRLNGTDLETAFAQDPTQGTPRLPALVSDFANDINLVSGGHAKRVVDYIYVRSYGVGPSKFMVVFDKPAAEAFEISIDGHKLGFDRLSLPFSMTDIRNIPNLKL